jgi:hypothetical protein
MRRGAFGAHRITDCVPLDSGFRRNDILLYGRGLLAPYAADHPFSVIPAKAGIQEPTLG